jgi:hypothetical protein
MIAGFAELLYLFLLLKKKSVPKNTLESKSGKLRSWENG